MRIFVLGTRGFPSVQGGVEKYCEELYPGLVELGSEVTVAARKHYFLPSARTLKWKGVNFIYLPSPQSQSLETFVHTFLATLVCIFKRPDIAHFHNIGPALFLPIVKLFGIKTVLTYHSINYYHQKWNAVAKLILKAGEFLGIRFGDEIIVVSKTFYQFLTLKYPYLSPKLKIIPPGVTYPQFLPPGETLAKYKLKPREYVFTVARLTPEKGVHDLLRAYLKIKNPLFKLVITGELQKTKYTRELSQLAKGEPQIIFTGFLSGKPLSELYSHAGLFVLPSYYEGLPIALLEALNYRLPVLVSNIPVHKEIPLSAERYFACGNIKELAQKIPKLLEKGPSGEELERIQKVIREEYNWAKIIQKTLKVYQEVINGSGTPASLKPFARK
jgi:glycosyltransferase involved in cell wall biosynthesis